MRPQTPKRRPHRAPQSAGCTSTLAHVPSTEVVALTAAQAKQAVSEGSEEGYKLLFESNPIPMWVFDRTTLRFLAVNQAAIGQYGYTEQEFLASTIADIRPEKDVAALRAHLEKPDTGLQKPEAWTHRRKDGSLIDVAIVAHPIRYHEAKATLVAAIDVTERNAALAALQQAEHKYRTIFENAVVGIFVVTLEGRPLNVNRAMAQIHGFDSSQELIESISNTGRQIFVDPARMEELHHAVGVGQTVCDAEVEIYCKDRSRKWILINLQAERDTAGAILFLNGTAVDITARKLAEERVQSLAYFDGLTGLPNRALMNDRLAHALARARRRDERVSVLFLDLDRFKFVNDSLGHSVGDLVLQVVARRIKGCIREEDTVARMGGDGFVVILSGAQDPVLVADRIQEVLKDVIEVKDYSISIGCSIGISVFPEHDCDGETLIKFAELAMYDAKEGGRNAFRFFSADMDRRITERTALENDLRHALEAEEFFLVYQPQISASTGVLSGLEALIRWKHLKRGLIPPDQFIGIAENSGLILPIGEWVLQTACKQARAWLDRGLLKVPVAVNVSAVQFRQAEFFEVIKRALRDSGLPPRYLELEITESVLLTNQDLMASVLRQVKQLGVNLAIDDFGTGYSSLSYLRQFHVSKLKIDRSFIREVTTNSEDAVITTAIINMAKSLNLVVVAEGVEDHSQFEFLRAHSCDEIQGYYTGRPGAPSEIAEKFLCIGPR